MKRVKALCTQNIDPKINDGKKKANKGEEFIALPHIAKFLSVEILGDVEEKAKEEKPKRGRKKKAD